MFSAARLEGCSVRVRAITAVTLTMRARFWWCPRSARCLGLVTGTMPHVECPKREIWTV
jgi:hypothetical protein